MLPYAFLKSISVAALGVAILTVAPAAEAGSTAVGGKRMSCGAAKVVWSTQYNYNGYAKPGQIFLNPRILRTYPPATRQFIFLHECAHQYVGYNRTEQAADCWAVRRGKRRGWLTKSKLNQICRSMHRWPGNSVHLPGGKRCEVMKVCFDAAPGQRSASR